MSLLGGSLQRDEHGRPIGWGSDDERDPLAGILGTMGNAAANEWDEMMSWPGRYFSDNVDQAASSGLLGYVDEGVSAIRSGRPVPDITEDAAMDALDMLGPGLLGMTVFHGSPHKWSKLDFDKIGTGEGAQAYGHGMYTAQNRGVAEGYQKTLSEPKAWIDGREVIYDPGSNSAYDSAIGAIDYKGYQGALDHGETMLKEGVSPEYVESYMDSVRGFKDRDIRIDEGHLYELDLPDDQIGNLLDWDAPLSEQKVVRDIIEGPEKKRIAGLVASRDELKKRLSAIPKDIRSDVDIFTGKGTAEQIASNDVAGRLLAKIEEIETQISGKKDIRQILQDDPLGLLGDGPSDYYGSLTGRQVYDNAVRQARERLGTLGKGILNDGAEAAASEYLNSLGIPGIKYLDGGSRSAGQGTRNYVAFGEGLLTPLTRNGESLLLDAPPWKQPKTIYEKPVKPKPNEFMYMDIGNGSRVEVVQNPTSSDYRAFTKEVGRAYPGEAVLRHTQDADGNKYIWKAHEATHGQIEPMLGKRVGALLDQNAGKESHRRVVRQALYEGKDVPDYVMQDYPGLLDEMIGMGLLD